MLNASNGLFYRDIVSAAVRGEVVRSDGPRLHTWWTKSPPPPDPDPPARKIFIESTPPGPKGQFYEAIKACQDLKAAQRSQRIAERDELWAEILAEEYGDLP